MKLFTSKEEKKIDIAINQVLEEMESTDKLSNEYTMLVTHLANLNRAKANLSEGKKQVDPNTILVVGVGFIETLVILNYEKLGVIASKAFRRLRGRV